jgi:prepilin peptidase CpaA
MQATLAANLVQVVTAATLFYVALTDLREFKIRNELIVVLAGLYVLWAVLSGRWTSMHWNVGLAALMFLLTFYFYAQGLMGGGDVKMLAVAFLWVGLQCALIFALLLVVFILIHLGAVKLGWTRVQQVGSRKRIPFAPSIASALIVTFMSGCLQGDRWPEFFWQHGHDQAVPNLTVDKLQKQIDR